MITLWQEWLRHCFAKLDKNVIVLCLFNSNMAPKNLYYVSIKLSLLNLVYLYQVCTYKDKTSKFFLLPQCIKVCAPYPNLLIHKFSFFSPSPASYRAFLPKRVHTKELTNLDAVGQKIYKLSQFYGDKKKIT